MRIEEDLKLGFKDVLIRPKRSTLKSRSDVELAREYHFKHSGWQWSGVPLIAANMDTVGTFSMARVLAGFDVLTAVHKHYSVEQWQAFVSSVGEETLRHVMVSTGTSEADFIKLRQILALSPSLKFICIDVANGYSEHFVDFLRKARDACPDKVICAGNVVTGEMVEELILSAPILLRWELAPAPCAPPGSRPASVIRSSPPSLSAPMPHTGWAGRSCPMAAVPCRVTWLKRLAAARTS